ncbi:MAG: hypothetical protein RTU63_06245 [Candidatus Thorarchaeota archaeon]
MNKKRICSLICVTSIVGLIASTVIIVSINSRETIRDLEIQNPDGLEGTVFVVFRPGVTSFNEDIVNEFIRGLVDSDWRVEVTTTSTQTPTNVTGYDLIVLGSPVNGGMPHESMLVYLTRIDFEGRPVFLILTSGGAGGPGLSHFRNATVDVNGIIHGEIQYHLFESGARNSAYTAGTEVTLGA